MFTLRQWGVVIYCVYIASRARRNTCSRYSAHLLTVNYPTVCGGRHRLTHCAWCEILEYGSLINLTQVVLVDANLLYSRCLRSVYTQQYVVLKSIYTYIHTYIYIYLGGVNLQNVFGVMCTRCI